MQAIVEELRETYSKVGGKMGEDMLALALKIEQNEIAYNEAVAKIERIDVKLFASTHKERTEFFYEESLPVRDEAFRILAEQKQYLQEAQRLLLSQFKSIE